MRERRWRIQERMMWRWQANSFMWQNAFACFFLISSWNSAKSGEGNKKGKHILQRKRPWFGERFLTHFWNIGSRGSRLFMHRNEMWGWGHRDKWVHRRRSTLPALFQGPLPSSSHPPITHQLSIHLGERKVERKNKPRDHLLSTWVKSLEISISLAIPNEFFVLLAVVTWLSDDQLPIIGVGWEIVHKTNITHNQGKAKKKKKNNIWVHTFYDGHYQKNKK